VYDAITVEEMNKPAVTLVNKDFIIDAESAASSQGMPVLRVVPEAVPCECSVMEDVEAGVSAIMDNVLVALTKPLTAAEKSPKKKEVENPSRIVFKGALEEVNHFFYRRGWTDGLPVVPPTEEAVAEMLTGTDMAPDLLIAKLEPRMGKATVEKIAINAVMAGALPIYMPLLIAAVQVMVQTGFSTASVSTGSWTPFWIVNGPIRKDLHINGSTGALSPGDMANAAIARAMGLIIKNIGGIRKAIEDMGTLGNPGKYAQIIGENEEESPWEPMHVEYGFKKEDSTVCVSFPNTYVQIQPYGTDDNGILRAIVYNLVPGRRGGCSLVFSPQNAKTLARLGWTKKDVKAFVAENSQVPAYRLMSYWALQHGGLAGEKVPMINTDTVPLVRDPDTVRVLVAGGPGAWIGLHVPGFSPRSVMKKVELPANWDKLLAKYKNLVPTYLRY
jgi:SpoU rRNA methylase family enzyme